MTKELVNALRTKLIGEAIAVLKTAEIELDLSKNNSCLKVKITNDLIWNLGTSYFYPDEVLTALIEKENLCDWLAITYNKYKKLDYCSKIFDFLDYGIIAEVLNISLDDAKDISYDLKLEDYERENYDYDDCDDYDDYLRSNCDFETPYFIASDYREIF